MIPMFKILLSSGLLIALVGCRGGISEDPPVHLVLDMDFQPKIKSQSATDFEGWSDHRGMRQPVAGAVARRGADGETLEQWEARTGWSQLSEWTKADGSFVTENPLALTTAVMQRGRQRFDIHCSACHGYSGRGGTGPDAAHGIVGKRWPKAVQIPSFIAEPDKDNRVPSLSDGEVFDVITKGKGTMPAYGRNISVEDRWAIIHYLRAIQEHAKQ